MVNPVGDGYYYLFDGYYYFNNGGRWLFFVFFYKNKPNTGSIIFYIYMLYVFILLLTSWK